MFFNLLNRKKVNRKLVNRKLLNYDIANRDLTLLYKKKIGLEARD